MALIGPATTKVMRERKHQGMWLCVVRRSEEPANDSESETRDGKKYYDPAPHSEEMQKLNKAFSSMHGISSLLNLTGFIATLWYGVSLAARIQ